MRYKNRGTRIEALISWIVLDWLGARNWLDFPKKIRISHKSDDVIKLRSQDRRCHRSRDQRSGQILCKLAADRL